MSNCATPKGRKQTENARAAFRASMTPEAYAAHMAAISRKGVLARRRKAIARRQAAGQ